MSDSRSRPTGAKSCGDLLAAGGLKRLQEHSRRLEHLSRLLRSQLPAPLAQHCRVANLVQQTLVLHIDSPAWSAKLRYHSPQLLDFLRRQPGLEQLRDIRIHTVPHEYPAPTDPPPGRRLSGLAAHLLNDLAGATPVPTLKTALLRLAGRNRSGD